jgi:hypothetical protein
LPPTRAPLLLVLVFAGGCAKAVPVPANPAQYHEFTVAAPRDRVFDAILKVGQQNNLNVAVLEKSSGLIRFDNATFSATQLDNFCLYPFTHSRSGKSLGTFDEWNQRSLKKGTGPVLGSVSLNVVLTEVSPGATAVNIRGNWMAQSTVERYVVNSQGVLEKLLEEEVRVAVQ